MGRFYLKPLYFKQNNYRVLFQNVKIYLSIIYGVNNMTTSVTTITRKDKRTRLLKIIRTMRNYNMIHNFVHQTNPQEFREALETLGPTFIKAGQILSTRPDLISPEYVKELRKLQDNVQIDNYETVEHTFLKQTGQTISETFASFDKEPFASASIGQTHYATLKDGTKVVVKIQHPGVEELVRTDLALFRKALSILKFVPDLEVIDAKETLYQIQNALLNEINTQNEIKNGIEFYNLNNNEGIIRVPKVYEEYSTSKVLVNQAMAGKSIKYLIQQKAKPGSQEAIELEQTKKYVARTLVQNFIKQVFKDNFFHADPHPGNILFHHLNYKEEINDKHNYQQTKSYTKTFGNNQIEIEKAEELPPYRLVYLDFGMMGRLTPALIDGIAQLVMAISTRNPRSIGEAVLAVCNRTGKVDEESFYEELGLFVSPYLKMTVGQIDFTDFLYQMIALCRQNNLQIKPEVTLLFKAFGTLEGTIAQLDPNLSLMDVARPFGIDYLKKKFNLRNSFDDLALQTFGSIKDLPSMPQKISQLLDIMNSSQARLTLKLKDQNKLMYRIDQIVNRIMVTIILAAVILGSSMLVQGSREHSPVYNLGVFGFILSLVVIVLMVIGAFHRRWKDKHHNK